jgi:spermidine/putrescine-binding protein
LVAGDVVAAQLWSTTSQQAIDALPELTFCFPSEGFAVYPDTCVVLEESPRKEAAHMFLDYLLRPNVAAAIVQATRTATVNADARALLPPETRNNQTLYPPPEIMKRGEWAKASTPEIQRLRDRLWTEVKSS